MNRPIVQPAKLLIKQLQGKIRQVETTARNDDGTIVSSGSVDVDAMLPNGGYNRGTIVQWLSVGGCGAAYLSLLAAKNAARDGGAIVIIDHRGEFFPPAARAMGINLGNLIVLKKCSVSSVQEKEGTEFRVQRAENREIEAPAETRPSSESVGAPATVRAGTDLPDEEDFLWAIDQSLRCPAVAAVWGQLPEFKTPLLAERWSRRFQLSAESSGCLGLFISKTKRIGHVSQKNKQGAALHHFVWSEIQWHLHPQPSSISSINTTPPNTAPPLAGARPSQSKDVFRQEPQPPDSLPSEHRTLPPFNTRIVRALLNRCRGGVTGRAIDLEINLVTGNVQRARGEHANKQTKPSRPLSLASQLAHSKARRRAAGA